MTLIASILFACASAPIAPPQPPPPTPVELPANASCIDECMKANMARSVSVDVIKSDCTQACSNTDPLTPLVDPER